MQFVQKRLEKFRIQIEQRARTPEVDFFLSNRPILADNFLVVSGLRMNVSDLSSSIGIAENSYTTRKYRRPRYAILLLT